MLSLFGMLGLMLAGMAGGSLFVGGGQTAGDDNAPADPSGDPDGHETGAEPPPGQIWDEPEGEVSGFSSDWVQSGILSDGGAPDPATPPGQQAGLGLEGGEADDLLTGGTGDDQINGREGDDSLFGSAGDDSLLGFYGDDLLVGEQGDDDLAGQEGNDRLEGGPGHDTLFGGNGQDSLYGGAGDDWLAGGMGDDLLVAGPGQDTLDGDAGDDTLIGARAGEAGNYLNGGDGDDLLRLGAGDIATGGEGADRFELSVELHDPELPATIMDFTADEDSLVLVYGAGLPAPQITLLSGPLPDETQLLVDGQPLARIFGSPAPQLEAIRLIAAPQP